MVAEFPERNTSCRTSSTVGKSGSTRGPDVGHLLEAKQLLLLLFHTFHIFQTSLIKPTHSNDNAR